MICCKICMEGRDLRKAVRNLVESKRENKDVVERYEWRWEKGDGIGWK